MFDVEEIPTHGGSLRIYAKHKEDMSKSISPNVAQLIAKEINKGINDLTYYKGFQERAEKIKLDLWSFLIEQKRQGKKVAAYGAAAKGNTLLNYCCIKMTSLLLLWMRIHTNKTNFYLPVIFLSLMKTY